MSNGQGTALWNRSIKRKIKFVIETVEIYR